MSTRLTAQLTTSFLLLALLAPAAAAQGPAPSLKALIVTGQNTNHDWRVSTPALKRMLEATGLFEVEVVESPPPGAKMNDFAPRFSAFRLVVLNYCGDSWPPATRRAFSSFVRNGGGVVAYHAAAIAFPGWPEYNEIIGLGGWSGRNESFGPYIYWKDGAVRRDPAPGLAGYHPQPFVYPVVHRDTAHPITAGLPARWMHAGDELYSLLRGPAKNLTVLATARSGFENGGTGRDEPVLFTVAYGSGRVFHTVLGHAAGPNPPGLECAGFITTFQRGAEWAATGRVTQPVPPDFPVTDRDGGTPEDVRLWPGFRPPALEPILKDLAGFQYSRDESVLYRLREYVLAHNKSEPGRAACERELLAAMETMEQPEAVLAICRGLRLVGSERSVPALERRLMDEATADAARYALEKIPGAAADAALLNALAVASDDLKLGLVSSLAGRRSAGAVAALTALVASPEPGLGRAAVIALGRIEDPAAAAALADAFGRSEGPLKTEIAYALLGPVHNRLAARDLPAALALSEPVLSAPADALPKPVRQAAFTAKLLSLENPEAARLVVEALTRGPQEMHQPALGQAPRLFSDSEVGALAALLPRLPEATRVQLIAVLADYPRSAILAPLADALKSESKPTRLAALKALAKIGDASTAVLLARRAAEARGDEQAAARAALGRLPGKEVDEAILFQLLASPDDALKSELIRAVGERRIAAGKGLLVNAVRAGTANSAPAARALRTVAEPADIPALLEVLLQAGEETVQDEMRTTIGSLAQRTQDAGLRAGAVRRWLVASDRSRGLDIPEINVRQRALLYLVLGNIGDNSALPDLREALAVKDAGIQDAAVRALSAWPDPAAREDCLAIAQNTDNLNHKVLALRGYVRMVGLDKFQSPRTFVRSLKPALDLADRPEEKILILGALQEFPSADTLALAESLASIEAVQAEARAAAEAIKEKLKQ